MTGDQPVPTGNDLSDGVLPDGAWRSAAFCGPNGGNCVEVNLGARGVVGVRDSKSVPGPVLTFDDAGWAALLDEAKSGRFALE